MNQNKIFTDHSYINSKRYKYDIDAFLRSNTRGVPDNVIASLLCITVEEIEKHYKSAIKKLRDQMGVDE